MTADLPARFRRFLQQKKLVSANDRVLVAVSGGIDSMVMLHLFKQTATELGIDIVAAHFDHAMRPQSADDAAWVERICAEWGVPLVSARTPETLRSEADARAARYEFLLQAMQQNGATRIATAHHADDQIETVLFRLMRGAGLRGLSGIPVRRGAIIRPMLRFRKKELETYAAHHHIDFRADETNLSERFARNRIRRAVIPALQAVRAGTPSEVLNLARHAARAERGWEKRIHELRKRVASRRKRGVSELARSILLEYDGESQARLLRAELRPFGIVPNRVVTTRLLEFVTQAGSGSTFDVGDGVRIERAYDVLRITRTAQPGAEQNVRIAACDDGNAVAEIGGRSWRVQWLTSPMEKESGARFGCAALHFPLEVRSWRAGDRIRMPYGTKKLKKLFAEARIPVHERASVPVLVDGTGRVCWVVGVARSIEAPPHGDASALTVMVTDAENS